MEAATFAHVEEEVARQKSVFPMNPYPFFNSRLPTETLQDIFILCAQDYHYQHLCPTDSVPNWVNVSYVCRQWRNVALGCPTLWTYLFITSCRWTEVLLARSKQASLKMRVSLVHLPRTSPGLGCFKMVMNHVERIQKLYLHLSPSVIHRDIHRGVFSGLFSRAPRLQDLDMTIEYSSSSTEWPSLLFGGDTPALRTLRLVDCPAPLHSFRPNALTVLRLVSVPVRFQKNMEEFLATLSCMQDLKHLQLCHALPSATDFLSSAVFKTFEKIDLTQLSCLWIGAPLSTTVTLLSCINIPLKTQVRLECISEHSSSRDHHALLLSLLAQRYKDQAQCSPTIHSLIIHSAQRGAMLTFSPHQRDTTSAVYEAWDRNIPLHIELDYLMVDKDVIISDICSSMPLSNVQTLSVVQPIFSPVFWRRILQQLQDVRYITLSYGNMPDLSVLSLTDHTAHDSESEDVQNLGGLAACDQRQRHILAPRLENLELTRITFLPEYDVYLPEPAMTCGCLFEALSTRRLEGPSGRLTMTQCNVPDSVRFDMVALWGGGSGCYTISREVHTPDVDVDVDVDLDVDLDFESEVDLDSEVEEGEGWEHD